MTTTACVCFSKSHLPKDSLRGTFREFVDWVLFQCGSPFTIIIIYYRQRHSLPKARCPAPSLFCHQCSDPASHSLFLCLCHSVLWLCLCWLPSALLRWLHLAARICLGVPSLDPGFHLILSTHQLHAPSAPCSLGSTMVRHPSGFARAASSLQLRLGESLAWLGHAPCPSTGLFLPSGSIIVLATYLGLLSPVSPPRPCEPAVSPWTSSSSCCPGSSSPLLCMGHHHARFHLNWWGSWLHPGSSLLQFCRGPVS